VIKPQISKDYATQLVLGRPDMSILENNFELGDKFYEPQYSITKIRAIDEENGAPVEIKFRESES